MPCRAIQDRWVMVKSSGKMWSTGEGDYKPHQYSFCENPMNTMKRQKDMTLEDELSNMLLEMSGEITRKRKKSWSQI